MKSKVFSYIIVFLFLQTFFVFSQERNKNIDNYLSTLVRSNSLAPKDITEYKITDYSTSKNKIEHYYFRQQYLGLDIIGTESSIHVFKGEIISASNKFVKNKAAIVKAVTLNKNTPQNIISSLAEQMGYGVPSNIYRLSSYNNNNSLTFSNAGISKDDIPMRKVFYLTKSNVIVSGWQLSIHELSGGNWWNFIVSDITGDVLKKVNWKADCRYTNSNNKVNYSDNILKINKQSTTNAHALANTSTYNVFSYPVESPNFGPRSIVNSPENSIASPFGWHDIDGLAGADHSDTRGNNVDAFKIKDDLFFRPDGGDDLIFDFPLNNEFTEVNTSESAAITNLFYWNNIVHDIMYQYGFDEENGNFQANNYDKGGLEDDYVLASSQSDRDACNAYFSTPPDGLNGELFVLPCRSRDGSLDNHVIVHEYAHGISIRLSGGPSNSDCLDNLEQMGEGWSDWYANMLTMKKEDLPTNPRTVGTWLFGEGSDGLGVRDFPYSTDLNIDPRTYGDVSVSRGVHQVGSIWAAMLWELTWGLIEVHGFDEDIYNGNGGNNIALTLVTEALKLQPCSPGFVDGRDAILAADRILYNSQNQCVIWDAFAKRGLGLSASQGSPFSITDGMEAFDTLSVKFNIDENSICELQTTVTLTGGVPVGGVYSGPGVTDSGDGVNFMFNPTEAGVGSHTITYTNEVDCASNTDTVIIEVLDNTPPITCKNATVTLDENDSVTITAADVVEGLSFNGGYIVNENETYSPIDIFDIETKVLLSDDSVSTELPIGFDFNFFGETYSNFYISSNGFLTFNNNSLSGCCTGQRIPNNGVPNNLIAFGWADLNPTSTNYMSYATIGTAPNRVLIVSANNVVSFSGIGRVDAQVKLFENSNIIEMHSTNVSLRDATQGIENATGTEAFFVEGRRSSFFELVNEAVSFSPRISNSLPNHCGLSNTIAIDVENFTCDNLGENTVNITVTDELGASSMCSTTVNVLPFNDITFSMENTSFCDDDLLVENLGGGLPIGGKYSGDGVVDNENGTSFSLDVSTLAIGDYTVFYEFTNSCGIVNKAEVNIEVIASMPVIECQDVSLELGVNGIANLIPNQILTGSDTGSLLALNRSFYTNNTFNTTTNQIDFVASNNQNTFLQGNTAIDFNPVDNMYYILGFNSLTGSRSALFKYNPQTPNIAPVFIDDITSSRGTGIVLDLTFDNVGNLYFIFSNGDIDKYNLSTKTIRGFSVSGTSFNTIGLGFTYNYDNNKLIYLSLGELYSVDVQTGQNIPVFTTLINCGADGLEYVGNNKLIVTGANTNCNDIYSINLLTQEVGLIPNSDTFDTNSVDLMFIPNLPRHNCTSDLLKISLSKDVFDCNDIGENEITVTAESENGNLISCSSTVTIINTNKTLFDMENTVFCIDEGLVTNLTGGKPIGGVYSGVGVIDNQNGTTFSLDLTQTQIGTQNISYQYTNPCGTVESAELQIEILPNVTEILCEENIDLELDTNGQAVLNPENLILNSHISELFILSNTGLDDDIKKFEYSTLTNQLNIVDSFSVNTGLDTTFAISYNNINGVFYVLGEGRGANRPLLYTYSVNKESPLLDLLDSIESTTGTTRVYDMTFDGAGNLYFIFNSGEINKYDINTKQMSIFSNVGFPVDSTTSLAYDANNDRLIYSYLNNLYSVNLISGVNTLLFDLNDDCNMQTLEYIGDNKLLSSTISPSCNKMYTIDLETQEVETILSPVNSVQDILDMVYVPNVPKDNCSGLPLALTINKDLFTCSDIGENLVTLTATNSAGNQVSCTTTVNVKDVQGPTLETLGTFTLDLDVTGAGHLTIEDLLVNADDACSDDITFNISKTDFQCRDINVLEDKELIVNGSFEQDLVGWQVTTNPIDLLQRSCVLEWMVAENSLSVCCCVANIFPTHENNAAYTSFDSSTPNTTFTMEQTITVPSNIHNTAILSFDWLANFRISPRAIENRRFTVVLTDEEDNLISTIYNYDIPKNGPSIINEKINLDISTLLFPYLGENVKIKFNAFVPERSTGPSKSLIDNVSLITRGDKSSFEVVTTATDASGNSSSALTTVSFTNILNPCPVLSTNTDLEIDDKIQVYPNPTKGNITINWQNTNVTRIQLYDINSRLINNKEVHGYSGSTNIALDSLSSGVYFLKLFSDNKLTIKKIIKEN